HTLHRKHHPHHTLQTTLAHHHTHHHTTHQPNQPGQPSHHTKLPTYPFQGHPYWLDRVPVAEVRAPVAQSSPRDVVRGQLAVVLGVADPKAIAGNRTFKELGFDSAAAVELHRRLSTATGLQLPSSLTYDHPTPDAVIDFLRSRSAAGPGDGDGDEGMVEPVLEGLDEVRELLSGSRLAESARAVVAGRLSELLRLCQEADEPVESPGGADRLEAASDSEMFDFISNELGIS
ncbi:phosphopantetheine-binding protein, partial [Streptomyces sp. NPDC048436]|uniref:phosphopantetheine-binding protein n=1 Tax=Streptomyces sp. NPDC048436 TaxID=3365550 RepID=UPI00371F17A3